MVQAAGSDKFVIKLVYPDANCRVEMALESTLSASQQMTGLLYAIDQLK